MNRRDQNEQTKELFKLTREIHTQATIAYSLCTFSNPFQLEKREEKSLDRAVGLMRAARSALRMCNLSLLAELDGVDFFRSLYAEENEDKSVGDIVNAARAIVPYPSSGERVAVGELLKSLNIPDPWEKND